ncbi:HbrB family protein involved in TOR signaling Bit2 [Schizosaccharomyces pombe]|uniref:Uncharacterized protein C6B12.03c n=1 Tax=Schizosaccharomyces pombe (strain 972 / ATCC 24843) TaxID=284812 RepID=YDT3_SCHPO|nr:HbrB family protein [Schizosaccharomyces pombe]O14208.1 RecName: Full=Uncharacterized protein C6B12.03c [Schizosaccharomyces pombe 972h-]CAB11065.1 HbrB family protein [Schizosaccharomyces pombe]|eukprot:NP_593758.1 HbrB family protein [Schizosaccharomyces pombe]
MKLRDKWKIYLGLTTIKVQCPCFFLFHNDENRTTTSNLDSVKSKKKRRKTISDASIVSNGSLVSHPSIDKGKLSILKRYKMSHRLTAIDKLRPLTVLVAWKQLNIAMRPIFPQHRYTEQDKKNWKKKVIIEDLNFLVLRCICACEAISDFEELLGNMRIGLIIDISLLGMNSNESSFLHYLVEVWSIFYLEILPYIEATFLPVTFAKFEIAQLFEEPMKTYWLKKSANIDLKLFSIWVFRKFVVMPKLKKTNRFIEIPQLNTQQQILLVQMISIISLIKPQDESEDLLMNWLNELTLKFLYV